MEGSSTRGRPGIRWWQVTRRVTQVAVVALMAYVGLRHAQLFRGGPIDAYCPFGAVETLPALILEGGFVQKTALSSFVVLGGVLGMSALGRASFCGWLCPLGAVEDAIHAGGRWVARLIGSIPGLGGTGAWLSRWGARRGRRAARLQALGFRRVDGALRSLRYVAFGLIVLLTARAGSLVFADYDPFRVLFHFSFESNVAYVVLGLTVVSSLLVERFWCRYLCPVGAAVSLVSRFSPAGIVREEGACIDCGRCDKACGLALPVATVERVKSGQCTLCAECVGSCPTDALSVSWGAGAVGRRLSEHFGDRGPASLRTVVRPLAAVTLFVVLLGGAMAAGAWETRASAVVKGSGSEHAEEEAVDATAAVGAQEPQGDGQGTGPEGRAPLGAGDTIGPDEVKGYMTVAEVAAAFGLTNEDILGAIGAPATEDANRALREVTHQYGQELDVLREWLAEQGF